MQVSGVSHITSIHTTHQNDVDFLNDQIAKLKKELEGVTGNSEMAQKLEFDKKALIYLQSNPGSSLGYAYVSTVVAQTKSSITYMVMVESHEYHLADEYLQKVTQMAQKTAQNPAALKSAFEYQPSWNWS